MKFIASAIYKDIEALAQAGYSGTMLTKWVDGVLVQALPQKQMTLKEARLLQQCVDKRVAIS